MAQATPHQVVKPEQIAAVAAVALEETLVIPAVFQREGIEQYKGAEGDAITVKVEGVLPYHTYGWRNDRSADVVFDNYAERKVTVTFGDDIYSGVKLTDEQNDFDLPGWAKLAAKQTKAIGRGLEHKAVAALNSAPYEVVLGLDATNLRKGLIRARNVMNRLRVPEGQRVMLVGSDVEAALLDDDKVFGSVANVGGDAVTALQHATLASRYGFNFVTALELAPDEAIAMVDSAFIFATGAPSVPQSAPFGAAASYNGVALRWIRDYDMVKTTDRSLFNTYQGFRNVTDILVGTDDATGFDFVSVYEHFVRAIKLKLGADAAAAAAFDVLPDPDGDDEKATELGNITGLWLPSNAVKATDSALIQEPTPKTPLGASTKPAAPGKAAKNEANPAV